MGKDSVLRRALLGNKYGAEARLLEDGTMIGPKVTGYHGSTSPWLLAGANPRFDTSAGLHVGTKAQAKTFGGESSLPGTLATYVADAVRNPGQVPQWPGFRGKVTLKEGREIGTPDLINWLPARWADSLDKVEGLTPAEKAQFGEFLNNVSGPDRHTTETVRRYLADQLGVKRVKYHNAGEGNPDDIGNNWSYIALSPDVAVTHSIPRQVAPYAATGAVVSALYPQDAGASSPQDPAPPAVLGAVADRLRVLDGAGRSGQAGGSSALARALAREAPRFNAALDTSLDVASFFDPTMGYATETARALKDLPAKVGPAGAVALAPLTGATEALGSIGQLPELGVAGGRALARAIARKPQPRGSQTYRKAR